jgi:hypothetical protein
MVERLPLICLLPVNGEKNASDKRQAFSMAFLSPVFCPGRGQVRGYRSKEILTPRAP